MFGKKKKIIKVEGNAGNPELMLLLEKNGNKFYTFINKPNARRFLVGMTHVEYSTMGVDSDGALKYLELIIDALNRNKLTEASYNAVAFKNRIVSANPDVVYLQLASVYIILNEEDPKQYNQVTTKEKLAIWQKDEQLATFFLNFAYNIIKQSSGNLNASIADASMTITAEILKTLTSVTHPK